MRKRKYGFTIVDGLQLLFLGLKLRGDIDWAWGWVFAPMIFSILILVIGEDSSCN